MRTSTRHRERSHRFDDLCVDAGRDPSTIQQSLVCFPSTPWQSVGTSRDMVGRFHEIGIDEFRAVLAHVA